MKRKSILQSEQGFVLVAAIMVLLILVVLGISATNTTILETQIAGNEKVGKITFYEADGGTEIGSELLEQNISCPSGFGTEDKVVNVTHYDYIGPHADLWYDSAMKIRVLDLGFWDREKDDIYYDDAILEYQQQVNDYPVADEDYTPVHPLPAVPEPRKVLYYPANYDDDADNILPHTTINMGGDTELGVGGAMQMAAGYEGVGKGAAGSGASIIYDIYAKRYGENNSESCLCTAWRHVIGQEDDCKY